MRKIKIKRLYSKNIKIYKKQKSHDFREFFGNIKVAGFDFDDTLVNEAYSIRKRWQDVLSQHSYLSGDLERTFFSIYEYRGPSYKFHVQDTLRKLNLDENLTKEIVAKFSRTHSGELLLAGSLELLKFLKGKNIKVGIITKGKQSFQEKRIKEAGIYEFMDFIYYGDQSQKPHTWVFEQCFKSFGLESPEQFLYIGNDFVDDIQSVSSLGAKACWFTNEELLPKIPKVIKVPNLKELLRYFKKALK